MLHCPAPPPFACCVVFKVCALSAYVCTFLLYLLCLHMRLHMLYLLCLHMRLHMRLLQLDTHSWQNAFLLHMLPLFLLFCFSAIMILRRVPLRRRHGTQHQKTASRLMTHPLPLGKQLIDEAKRQADSEVSK